MASKKVYRSSQGKSIDLGALLLQNETVRAVGNMGVNARGDRVDTFNKVVDSKVKQSQRAYNKQIGPQNEIPQESASPVTNVVPTKPVAPDPYELQQRNDKEQNEFKAQRKAEKEVAKVNNPRKTAAKKTPVVTEKFLDIEPTPEPTPTPEPEIKSAPKGGLAEAIARAKTIKQEALKTPRQQAQEQAGVKKI